MHKNKKNGKEDTSHSKNNKLVSFYRNCWAQTSLFSASYTIYGKNFLFVLKAWNLVPNSDLAGKIQIWYLLNSQMNCQASTRAQTSLLSASYYIQSKCSTHARILKITTLVNSGVMNWFLIIVESSIILIYFYLKALRQLVWRLLLWWKNALDWKTCSISMLSEIFSMF